MKKTLIRVGSFLGGFLLLGGFFYLLNLSSLEDAESRSVAPLVALEIRSGECFDETCAEVFTISVNGETSTGTQLDEGQLDTLKSLLVKENITTVEYLGFINPYCLDKQYFNGTVELVLTVDEEIKSFPLCQIVNLESNQLFNYVTSLLP